MIETGNIFCGSLCWMWEIFSKECKISAVWVCFKVRPNTIRSTCNSCLPLSPTYLVKIPSVLRVTAHTSTQSVVSLSAFESFQGAEEFTPSLDLSVGGIGNCKDKSLQQLKSSLLCTRACGISQISQIRPCPPASYQKSDHAHFHLALGEKDGDLECLCWGVGAVGVLQGWYLSRCPLLSTSQISESKDVQWAEAI